MSIYPYLGELNEKRSIQDEPSTIADLDQGYNWYPDLINFDYVGTIRRLAPSEKSFLKTSLSDSEANTDIAIIGAGPAGVIAAYELQRAGFKKITIYDGGEMASHFTNYDDNKTKTVSRAYTSSDGFEMGAMRFPDRAKLFWHYSSVALGSSTKVEAFPNPGTVPSLLNYQGQTYPFQSEVKDLPEKFTAVRDKFITAVKSAVPGYEIVSGLLQKQTLNSDEKKIVAIYWDTMIKKYENKSFFDFAKEDVQLTEEEMDILYSIGFGTGPFGPLFPVSFLEIARILIWDYGKEYKYSSENTVQQLIYYMMNYLLNPSGEEKITYKKNTTIKSVRRNSYQSLTLGDAAGQTYDHDRLVIATSHTSATVLMDCSARYADTEKQHPTFDPDSPLSGETVSQAAKEKLNYLIRSLQGNFLISASKVFVTLKKFPWEEGAVANWPKVGSNPVKVVLTDALPQQSYFIESSAFQKPGLLISYAWGRESNKQEGLDDLASGDSTNHNTSDVGANMLLGAYDRLSGFGSSSALSNPISKMYEVVADCNQGVPKSDIKVHKLFWNQTPGVFGGFKLNVPGSLGKVNALAFQYRFVNDSELPASYKKIVLCGDSFSYYGGWIEGAACSAVNAAAAIMYSIAPNKLDDEVKSWITDDPRPSTDS